MWTLHLSHVVKPEARPRMTYHARLRSRQRQITSSEIHLVLQHADLVSSSRSGRFRCQVSRCTALDLRAQGRGPQDTRQLETIVVIVAESGAVVTVYRRGLGL